MSGPVLSGVTRTSTTRGLWMLPETSRAAGAEAETGRKGELIAFLADVDGVRHVEAANAVSEAVAAGKLCWIDIVAADPAVRATLVQALQLDAVDEGWILRFDQAGRMGLAPKRLRAVTWLSDRPLGLSEVHLFHTRRMIVTVWTGDAAALDSIRRQFVDRACALERSPLEATAIVLQLLLATVHNAVGDIDATLERVLQQREKSGPGAVKLTTLTDGLHQLRSVLFSIDRYGSSVRLAVAGVEALPGIDPRATEELNDYADQVDDVVQRLQQRNSWASDITQDYVEAIAERQGEQIARLTIVSIVFLPITFLTGFFGMNFTWMTNGLDGPLTFLLLGVLLPVAIVALTVLWFKRRGLI